MIACTRDGPRSAALRRDDAFIAFGYAVSMLHLLSTSSCEGKSLHLCKAPETRQQRGYGSQQVNILKAAGVKDFSRPWTLAFFHVCGRLIPVGAEQHAGKLLACWHASGHFIRACMYSASSVLESDYMLPFPTQITQHHCFCRAAALVLLQRCRL